MYTNICGQCLATDIVHVSKITCQYFITYTYIHTVKSFIENTEFWLFLHNSVPIRKDIYQGARLNANTCFCARM